tara:strand:- start:314 stop:742 length:429 start_codon:yes stop_codon:yes gene_type:complete
MKASDFEEIMRRKYEAREKSDKYVEEAEENLKFVKHFKNYISIEKAYTNKKELALFGLPHYNMRKKYLEFNLDKFEDYLQKQRINLDRVDLAMKCQDILKAVKKHGKYGAKSCVFWRLYNQEMDKDDLIIEGEYQEVIDETA